LDVLGVLPKFYRFFGIMRMLTENITISGLSWNGRIFRIFGEFFRFLGVLLKFSDIFRCYWKKLLNSTISAALEKLKFFRIFEDFQVF
jgi:hypothetical protein